MREISGVDLNNDGTVDIVQHTNRSGACSLTVMNNNGNGTLSIGQNLTNVFVVNASNTTTAASMTWADFNGDGYMDLYGQQLQQHRRGDLLQQRCRAAVHDQERGRSL